MFCPQAVVWGDVASWVSAIAAVVAVVGLWFAYAELRDRRVLQAQAIAARTSALRTEAVNALSVFDGVLNGFRSLQTNLMLEPWLTFISGRIMSLDPNRLKSAAETPGLSPTLVEWCLLAANAIDTAQQQVAKAQQHPEHFRLDTSIQNAVAENIDALRTCAELLWNATNVGVEPPWKAKKQ